MKMRISRWFGLALAVAGLPLAGGCVQEAVSSNEPPTANNTIVTTSAVAPVAVTNVAATNPVVSDTAPLTDDDLVVTNDISTAEVKPINVDKPLPPNLQSNSPVAQIMKLADAGVDESVLMAFVTNTPAPFNLSADEIIYLNDIGVPNGVMTAMMQHDQEFKGTAGTSTFWSDLAQSNQTVVAQSAPNPATMAPQPVQQAAPQDQAQQAPPAPAESQVVVAPPTQVTYNSFYSSLAPYGTWVEVDGYGRCWQPTAVVLNPGWQPYLNSGRWVYSDYGWYWASDYSWGWAPFHYGRWFRHARLGWCWYPDTVWGASWVTWRYTDGYCGWAPLPPCAWYRPGFGLTYWGRGISVGFTFGLGVDCYAFVPWHHFRGHHLHGWAVPYHDRGRIYHNSVVATRFEGNRNGVFNRGLSPDRVAVATGTKVNRVTVTPVSSPRSVGGIRADRLAGDGRTLTVYKPKLSESPRPLPTAVVRAQRSTTPTATANLGNRETTRPGGVTRVERGGATTTQPTGGAVRPNRETVTSTTVNRPIRENTLANRQTTTVSTEPQKPISAASIGRPTPVINIPQRNAQVARIERTTPATTVARNTRTATTPTAPAVNRAPVTSTWQTRNPQTPAQQPVNRSATAPVYAPQNTVNTAVQQRSTRTVPQQVTPQVQQPVTRNVQQAPRTVTSPAYQAPVRQEVPRYAPAPTPTYQAPQRVETPRTAPAPTYQAPQRVETPRYSAPPAQSAPRATYSAPAQSSPRSSDSGGARGGGRPERNSR